MDGIPKDLVRELAGYYSHGFEAGLRQKACEWGEAAGKAALAGMDLDELRRELEAYQPKGDEV